MTNSTAASAFTQYAANRKVTGITVVDSAANLLANLTALTNIDAAALSSITLSGANSVTIDQAVSLAAFKAVLGDKATLVVSGSAVDLLKAGSAKAEALATSVTLTGANTVAVAAAETLAKLTKFSVDKLAKLEVTGSATDLLDANNADAIKAATAVTLTGQNSVAIASAKTLVADTGFSLGKDATLVVKGTLADITSKDNASALAKATGVLLTDDTSTTIAIASSLKSLKMDTNKSLTITGSATDLLATTASAAEAAAKAVKVTGATNVVSIADGEKLAKISGIALDTNVKLTVTGSAADILDTKNKEAVALATSVSLTGANTVAVADAEKLVKTANFIADKTATLVVTGSAADLINSNNKEAISAATAVTLTDKNAVAILDAKTLVADKGFTLGKDATLVLKGTLADFTNKDYAAAVAKSTGLQLSADATSTVAVASTLKGLDVNGKSLTVTGTATELLASTAASVEKLASAVKVTGTANTLDLADGAKLAAIAKIALDANAKLVVTGSAADIVKADYAAAETLATSVTLTGANTLAVADAEKLAETAHFAVDSKATLVVTGIAADLLDTNNAKAITAATAVTLTGENIVAIADAKTLVADKGFALAKGATFVVSGSIADLTDSKYTATLAKATSLQLSADGTTTVVKAAALKGLDANGQNLTLTGSATDLLAATATAVEKIASTITLTGTTNVVSVADGEKLVKLAGFALDTNAKLTVTGSAQDLIKADYKEAVAFKDVTVTLTGANTLKVADAEALVTSNKDTGKFSVDKAATVVVTGFAADLLDANNADAIKAATAVTLTGANTVAVADAKTLVADKGFTLAKDAFLVVSGSSSDLLKSTNSSAVAKATSLLLTGDNVDTVANITTLAVKGIKVDSDNNATLTVKGSAADLVLATNKAAVNAATAVTLTGANSAVSAADASALIKTTGFSVDTGATFVVAGSAASLLALDTSLTKDSGLATGTKLTGANTVSVADLDKLWAIKVADMNLAKGVTLTVADTAAHILAESAPGAEFASTVCTGIQITGNNLISDADKVTALAGLSSNLTLGAGSTLFISDALADIVTNKTAVEALAKKNVISSIDLTDAGALSLAADDYLALSSSLAKTLTKAGGTPSFTLNLTVTSSALNSAADTAVTNVTAVSASAATDAVEIKLANQSEALTITGGAGDDTITGGKGAETIKGGAGADKITGGTGVSTFDYTTFTDSLAASYDTISDFKATDLFKVGHAITSDKLKAASGTGTGDLATDIGAVATATGGAALFVASGATVVTLTGGSDAGKYLVINDSTPTFSAVADAVVKLSGTSISAVTAANFIS